MPFVIRHLTLSFIHHVSHHGETGAENVQSEASQAALCEGLEDCGFTGQLQSANVYKCIIMKRRVTQIETQQTMSQTLMDGTSLKNPDRSLNN